MNMHIEHFKKSFVCFSPCWSCLNCLSELQIFIRWTLRKQCPDGSLTSSHFVVKTPSEKTFFYHFRFFGKLIIIWFVIRKIRLIQLFVKLSWRSREISTGACLVQSFILKPPWPTFYLVCFFIIIICRSGVVIYFLFIKFVHHLFFACFWYSHLFYHTLAKFRLIMCHTLPHKNWPKRPKFRRKIFLKL